MLEKLKTYLLFGKHYCGIEHNRDETIHALLLEKKKGEVIIVEEFEAVSVEAMAKQLPKKQHVVLIINDDQILTKSIKSPQKDELKLVYTAFPNLNLENFYYEINSTAQQHTVSICRKNTIDALIENYKSQQVSIVGFSLGNSMISLIQEHIKHATFATSNAVFSKENCLVTENKITSVVNSEVYNVSGLEVSNMMLLSFSGALSQVLQAKVAVSNFEAEEATLLQNFKQDRFFRQFAIFGLGFILTLLLVNFFFFNSYYEKVQLLKETSQVNSMQKEKLLALKAVTDQKQKTVDDILKSAASKSSMYIDAIIHSMPNTIRLTTLDYQPLRKRLKKEKPVEITENIFSISGSSTDSEVFSKWIHTLETFDWVKKVVVVNYGKASGSNSDFSIQIKMQDE